jgi:hypothetical protein
MTVYNRIRLIALPFYIPQRRKERRGKIAFKPPTAPNNSAVDKPVKERPWAFSDSWTKAAELSSICAFKTEDLYSIYLLHCNKKLDIDSFWQDLFATNGIFDMKKYRVV